MNHMQMTSMIMKSKEIDHVKMLKKKEGREIVCMNI